MSFHASQTEVMTGEPVRLTLSVANSTVNPEMTLRLVLQLPPGLLLSGEGIDESWFRPVLRHLPGSHRRGPGLPVDGGC